MPERNVQNHFLAVYFACALILSPLSAFSRENTQKFNGAATLFDPEKHQAVATFTENCAAGGSATAKIVLKNPVLLTGTHRLEVYGAVQGNALISAAAQSPSGTTIREFSGKSSSGCVAGKTGVSLVQTPGGELGSLLIVLGNGTVHRRR